MGLCTRSLETHKGPEITAHPDKDSLSAFLDFRHFLAMDGSSGKHKVIGRCFWPVHSGSGRSFQEKPGHPKKVKTVSKAAETGASRLWRLTEEVARVHARHLQGLPGDPNGAPLPGDLAQLDQGPQDPRRAAVAEKAGRKTGGNRREGFVHPAPIYPMTGKGMPNRSPEPVPSRSTPKLFHLGEKDQKQAAENPAGSSVSMRVPTFGGVRLRGSDVNNIWSTPRLGFWGGGGLTFDVARGKVWGYPTGVGFGKPNFPPADPISSLCHSDRFPVGGFLFSLEGSVLSKSENMTTKKECFPWATGGGGRAEPWTKEPRLCFLAAQ